MSSVAPARSGDLGAKELQDAFVDLAVTRATGLFTATFPDGKTRYAFWSKGGPVAFRTEPLQEMEVLGVLLYKAKQISKEQLATSLQLMESDSCRQGEALMEMNVLTFPQLIMVLGKQVELILQRVMDATEGTWTFHPLDTLPEQFLPPPLRVPAMIYRAMVKKNSTLKNEERSALLGPYLDQYTSITKDKEPLLKEMRFDKTERKFLEVIHSRTWRLRELFSVCLLYTSPSPRDVEESRMPSSA